jgi:hypothetical protein
MVLSAARRCLLLFVSTGACAAPFPTRDQNPLLAGFGLPHAMPSRIAAADEWQFAADFNWGSSAILQTNPREALVVDAETRELRATVGRGLGERFALQLQVPYRTIGAGSLDGFIDDWHGWFSLPEGDRPRLSDDQYRIGYRRDGVTTLNINSSSSGLADICADVGYQIAADATSSLAAWLSVKLPTGDADKLAGSGATDVSLVIAGERQLATRWSGFGQLGASYLGAGALLPDQQRSVVWSGMAGIGFDISRSIELKAQIDAHSAAFDATSLEFLGDTALLTVGGSYRLAAGWQLDLGVSEDIVVEGSPDVVFVFGISQRRTGGE